MVCIYCGGKTRVSNSRWQKRNNQVWRRRECYSCHLIFTTNEVIDLKNALSVKRDGKLQAFLPDLLYTEVLLALQDRKDCYTASREVTDTIIRQLLDSLAAQPLFTPGQISKTTALVLKRFDKRAWLRYMAEHPSIQ